MRVDLFCFLDAANFFWTTIALAPSPGAGLPGLMLAAVGMLGWWRRRPITGIAMEDNITLYGCALDEYTGREGAPPCLSLRHATGEPKDR
jgi:hypothetical protein